MPMVSNFFTHTLHEYNLRSGAKLLYVSAPLFPLSVASVWVRAGSRFDPIGKEGLSHFFEHLLMVKTETYPEKTKRLSLLDSKGIEYNAFTNYETACYYHIQTQTSLLDSLSLLLDGLNNTVFDSEDVERERAVILDESERNFSDPAQYLWQLSGQGLWPKSSLARNFFGDENSLKNISLEDVMDFKEKFYIPENTVFVVIGDETSFESVKQLLEERYAGIEVKGQQRLEEVFSQPEKEILNERNHLKQITIGINYQLPSVDRGNLREIMSDFIRSYLASGWSSILIQKLRVETGLTYWVNGVLENFSDTGYMRFEFSVDQDKYEEACEIVQKEISKLVSGEIDAQALAATKSALELSLKRHYLDPKNLIWFYGWPFCLGRKAVSLDRYIRELSQLTYQDIVNFAKSIFRSENKSIALIGPKR